MPLGIVENGDGKRPKNGAAITAYEPGGSIYVLRGNNTVGFWKYQADTTGGRTIGWTKMKNIPIGSKRPKQAAGMAAFQQQGEGYIFTMKGSRNDEFYIYSISGDTWHKISSPPPGQSGRIGYRNGSCLAYDGDRFIYVLKGIYGDFFKYDLDSQTWTELKRYDYKVYLNRDGKKKKFGDGAGMVYHYGIIFALKGGNTNEVWKYDITSDTEDWRQGNPRLDIPTSAKKVQGGGCLTKNNYGLWAVRGANTPDFFGYSTVWIPGNTLPSIQPAIAGTQENKSLIKDFKLVIAPNPSNKVIKVNYNLPAVKPVNIKLYNISGALVKTYTNPSPVKNGVWAIDAKSLPAGVYVARFVSGEINAKCKIIIQK